MHCRKELTAGMRYCEFPLISDRLAYAGVGEKMLQSSRVWWDLLVDFLQQLGQSIGTKLTAELIAIPIVGALAILLRSLWKRLRSAGECQDCRERLERARNAVSNPLGLWVTKPVEHPVGYEKRLKESIPILTVANLKGGVGKTTIAANLAAHFAMKGGPSGQGDRVLLIDLDFQGSLSSMLILSDEQRRPREGENSKASNLIASLQPPLQLLHAAWPVTDPLWPPDRPRMRGIPAYYDLAQTENRLMVEWLIKDQPSRMPYFLAETLLQERLQDEFDLVIIDAPPRLTTGAIQALCASTHLLIPTILDGLSAEAVTTFVDQIETLKNKQVCPHIRYAGIVGSMVGTGGDPEGVARTMMDAIRDIGAPVDLLPQEAWVPDRAALNKVAGHRIAYIRCESPQETKSIREIFDKLGVEIRPRLSRTSSRRN